MDDAWQPDDFLAEFDSESFDVEKHATEILRKGNINEEVLKLTTALQSLDTCIEQHVSDHYSDLLSRAVASSELEQSLAGMATHINSLKMSTDRLRARVKDPYDKISAGTQSLSRLQETTDILRRVIRILQLSKKLAGCMGQHQSEPDLAKAASCLAEMSTLLQDDLNGLEVVEGEARRVRQWRLEVERQAEGLLTRGMSTGNQTHLATGLQVFYNLGTLATVMDTLMDDLLFKLRTHWTQSLDIKRITDASENSVAQNRTGPGKAAMPSSGNNAAFRLSLWSNIDTALESVHTLMSQLWLLQRLLTKKVDPFTHQPFITALHSPNFVLNSWIKICKILKDTLFTAQEKSNFVKQTFEGEYPKLVKLYEELWGKLKYTSNQYILSSVHLEVDDNSAEIEQVIFKDDMEDGLRDSLAQFENAYLARSLSRLFDPINLMLGSGGNGVAGQLSVDEVNAIITVITSELNIASVDDKLLTSVTKNIGKAVSLFCVKCEGCVDTEASQVIGQPSAAQLQNISIVNIMSVLSDKLAQLCSEKSALLGADRLEMLESAVRDIGKLMFTAVTPLLDSINDSVEAILLTMHKEDFSSQEGDSKSPAQACSLYMKELQAFLERISRDFLATFKCKDFMSLHLHSLAEKTIQRFVMQGSLVRPLGCGGAMRLASDCAQLEFALSTILGPSGHSAVGPTGLTALGNSYRLLRAFRALLFLTPTDMATFPGLGSTVPHSIAMQLLISRCPDVLPSPAASLGWSLARYTNWLEDHQEERERLLLIQGTLEAYVASARARQDKSYIPQYPVLLEILQTGLSS